MTIFGNLLGSAIRIVAAVILFAAVAPLAAAADNDTPSAPSPAPPATADPSKLLLGDVGGLRSDLLKHGFIFSVADTEEVLGNLTGGVKRGIVYEGLTDLSVAYDFRPEFAWRGNFFVRGYQIHGKGLSASALDNLNIVSGIEATATTRLYELWYEHHFDDWLRIRVGQQAASQEFLITTGAKPFLNSTFGWPTLPGVDLPSGGPNFPLATPAVRIRIDVNDEFTLFTGFFNGDPAGPGVGNPQVRDASGTSFRLNDGLFLINEIRYNPGNSPKSGTYRIGAWYDSESFADQQRDTLGLSLANPSSNGTPRQHHGDTSFYAIVDQPLFGGGPDGFAVFGRVLGAPSDRNLIETYLDGGITYKSPSKNLFGQTGDTIGLGIAYARIGKAVRLLAADTAALTGQPFPQRSNETVAEMTYQLQLMPGWQIQPDLQYVINPGGGIPNPRAPTLPIKSAIVAGLRTTINF